MSFFVVYGKNARNAKEQRRKQYRRKGVPRKKKVENVLHRIFVQIVLQTVDHRSEQYKYSSSLDVLCYCFTG